MASVVDNFVRLTTFLLIVLYDKTKCQLLGRRLRFQVQLVRIETNCYFAQVRWRCPALHQPSEHFLYDNVKTP
jgi:hypothetical protein